MRHYVDDNHVRFRHDRLSSYPLIRLDAVCLGSSVMSNAGTALMGIGRGEGKTKAEDAAAAAISSPLLDEPIDKAKGIVFNIVGGNDMSLTEVNPNLELNICLRSVFISTPLYSGLSIPEPRVWFSRLLYRSSIGW